MKRYQHLLGVWFSMLLALSAAAQPVSVDSLLKEMINRDAIARLPVPAYTCKQFSSYDRASVSPDKPETWFANGDVNQYLRVENAAGGRKEWVMMDVDGPGAIVRFWSANPPAGSTIRIYLDGNADPSIEVPFQSLLNGKGQIGQTPVGEPLAAVSANGWNLYLPIPYARHVKVTCDKDGFYYQLNYRTYAAGTAVESFTTAALATAQGALATAQAELVKPQVSAAAGAATPAIEKRTVKAGTSESIVLPAGPVAIREIALWAGTGKETAGERADMLQNIVIEMEFDGERTVWCPLSHFFGGGVGHFEIDDWYRTMASDFSLRCRWVMPYQRAARLTLINLSKKDCDISVAVTTASLPAGNDQWMHFHAAWRYEYPIHALGGKGTSDWNYIEVEGAGVFVGDNLAIMNPKPEWWGEGDEKIYVDGERFPSHFGTGTEDYYGYAWSSYFTFKHPFHGQPRCDGMPLKNNWGHSTVTRVRSLDAIPFTKSLKFDMEVWHWAACDVAYGATTYFYALPGAKTNRAPQPDEAAKPVMIPPPLPKPFKVEGALEAESLKVVAKTDGVAAEKQGGFGPQLWSGGSQLWVRGKRPGDFVELEVPVPADLRGKPIELTAYLTKSWDYGILKFSVNGQVLGKEIDTFNDKAHEAVNSGPLVLGTIDAVRTSGEKLVLRIEVVGGNAKAEGTKAFFGVDCLVLGLPGK